MIYFVLFALFAAVLLLGSALAIRGQSRPVRDLAALEASTQRVDLRAFRNLVDPGEREFLRRHLPRRDFRRIQRKRARATLEYVARVGHNAALLLRMGEAGRHHPDPRIAAAARQMANDAIRLRLYALWAMVNLYWEVLFPETQASPAQFIQSYEDLLRVVSRFAALQNPAVAGRVASRL